MSVKTMFKDVLAFNRKFRPEKIGTVPSEPDHDRVQLARRLMVEEFDETTRAMMWGDLPEIADGMVDLIYVVMDAAVAYGIDLPAVWELVQAANMEKEGGATRADGKILKPPGWVPPDVAGALASQLPLQVLYPDEKPSTV